MTNESGAVVTECVITEDLQKKFSRKFSICGWIFTAVGAAAFFACIAAVIAVLPCDEQLVGWYAGIAVSAMLFMLGVIFVLTVRQQLKNAKTISGVKNVYEFYSDRIIVKVIRNGEQTAAARLDYGYIVKTKDTPDVFYFYYHVKNVAYPIDKKLLSPAELNTIKKLCGLASEGEVLKLPSGEGIELDLIH